jgi:hypothetical protein
MCTEEGRSLERPVWLVFADGLVQLDDAIVRVLHPRGQVRAAVDDNTRAASILL